MDRNGLFYSTDVSKCTLNSSSNTNLKRKLCSITQYPQKELRSLASSQAVLQHTNKGMFLEKFGCLSLNSIILMANVSPGIRKRYTVMPGLESAG